MSIEKKASENCRTDNLSSRLETPNPFSPDWHHQFGVKLCAFPRYLVLPAEGVGRPEQTQFWPDLATFVEGPCWSVMMYYPGASRASVCVLHWKDAPRWEVIRFDDEQVVAKAVGSSYAETMALLQAW